MKVRVPRKPIEGVKEPVTPHNHLFEQEFVPGKGHKSGGMGGLFVKRQLSVSELAAQEKEQKRMARWLEQYKKNVAVNKLKKR